MKRGVPAKIAVLAVVSLSIPAAAVSSGRGHAGASPPDRRLARCPHDARPIAGYEGIRTTTAVVRALRRDVPRAFRNLTSMGSAAWPHYQVLAVFSLTNASGARLRSARSAWRHARELCGPSTASRSWSATLYFPYCQLPCAGPWTAYLAKTPRGWGLWYPWL